ncbi:MAG: gliding motility-associated C-terminal domain-containing protein [Bacteroidota bacterium]
MYYIRSLALILTCFSLIQGVIAQCDPVNPIILNATGGELLCNGDEDGMITLSVSGGTGPYVFLWDNLGGTDQNPSMLTAGVYTVTVTDAVLCTETASAEITQPPSKPSGTISSTDVSCFGVCDGSATVSPFGGTSATGQYSYLWDTGETTQSVSGICPGIHGVTITDDNGCSTGVPYIVPFPPNLIAVLTPSDVDCNGNATGSVTLQINFGGTPPFTFLWDNGSTDQNPTGLSAGTAVVTITDANGCSWIRQTDVDEPNPLIGTASDDFIDCAPTSSGTINLSVIGGTPPYSFLWSTGATTQDLSGVGFDIYAVSITDSNGCMAFDIGEVFGPEGFPMVVVNGNPESCPGAADGDATANPFDGSPPYSYLWSNGATTTTITGLAAGQYDVTITDDLFCETTGSVTISSAPAITLDFDPSMFGGGFNLACEGDDNGTLTVTPTGGTPPYTYSWATGQTVGSLSMLTFGTYSVTVTDNLGCSGEGSFTMTQPANKPSATVSTTDVTCFGVCDGSATASPFGGTVSGEYGFLWDTGETTAMVTGLCPGIHGVTISDDNGCSTGVPVFIPFPPNLITDIIPTDVSCNGGADGSIMMTITFGGTPPFTYLWSNGDTNEDPTGLTPGTYDVTITDSNNCPWVRQTTIGEPTTLNASTIGDDVDCSPGATGTISLSSSGGTPPYSFLWSTGATDQDLSGIGIGIYSVTVTDSNGCTTTSIGEIIGPEGSPTVSITAVNSDGGFNISCNGASDGSATANASDGMPPYTYLWSNGETTSTVNGLDAGPISVTVSDANNCMSSSTLTLDEPPIIDITWNPTTFNGGFNLACEGDDDGILTANPSGGNPPYSYLWETGETVNTLSMLSAGTYAITISDMLGCTFTDSFTMTQPNSQPSATVVTTDVSCFGTCDGTATASPFGGTVSGAYGFLWDTGETTAMVTGLCPGIHGVTITDDNGCSTGVPVNIPFPANLMVDLTPANVECNGEATGSIALNITFGGTPPFTFEWSGGAGTDQNPSGLTAGIYTVSITDANMCLDTRTAEITEPPQLTASATGSDLDCIGQQSGMISLSVGGGTPPYSYQWDNGAGTDQNPDGLPAGTFTVTVTDGNTCTVTTNATIEPPMDAPQVTVSSPQNPGGTNISCNGAADGSATASASDGTPPYTFMWSNGATSATITGLDAQTYSVTVSDANGCEVLGNVSINEPASPVDLMLNSPTSQGGTNIACNGGTDGSATAIATGGIAPYTYTWSNGQTGTSATGLTAGSYTITVTDINGCDETASVTLTEPMTPVDLIVSSATFESGTNISCSGAADGSGVATVSGGSPPYTYMWSNGVTDSSISGLGPGSYSVTVTDINGCEETANISLTEPTDPVGIILDSPTSDGGTNIACNGGTEGSANATVTGGSPPYTYAWNNGATDTSISGLGAGTYDFTVTDVNGCEETASITLTEPDGPVDLMLDSPTSQSGTNIACSGDTDGIATAIVSGGTPPYAYTWSDGQTVASATGLGAGTYDITVTDVNGCEETASVTLTEPMEPVDLIVSSATFESGTNISCSGAADGSGVATVSGGSPPYTYEWSNGETDSSISNLGPGTYTVTVTDVNGCEETANIILTEPSNPVDLLLVSPTSQGGTNIACNGGTEGLADATVTGGSPPYIYEWSNGETDTSISGIGAGTYNFTVTDVNGCEETASITLTEPDGPVDLMLDSPTSQGGTNIDCTGETDGVANANATGGTPPYTYTWSDGQTSASATGLGAGTYDITVTDINGCEETASITLTEPSNPIGLELDSPASQGGTNIDCTGADTGVVNAMPTGGTPPYTFMWSDGQTAASASGLTAGDYSVTVLDVNGCEVIGDISLTEPAEAIEIMIAPMQIPCGETETGSIDITVTGGTPPYDYEWSNGMFSEDLTDLPPGTYSVTVTDLNNCTVEAEVTIAIIGVPELDLFSPIKPNGFNIGSYLGSDGEIDLTVMGGEAPFTFDWSNGETSEDLSGLTAGIYAVTVTDSNGCEVSGSIELIEPTDLAIPNAISPNGDGENDTFVVIGLNAFDTNEFEVVNRWGNSVFKVRNYNNTWNGVNNNGEPLPDGTYFIRLDLDNGTVILTGFVDIRR